MKIKYYNILYEHNIETRLMIELLIQLYTLIWFNQFTIGLHDYRIIFIGFVVIIPMDILNIIFMIN